MFIGKTVTREEEGGWSDALAHGEHCYFHSGGRKGEDEGKVNNLLFLASSKSLFM